jgi:uncharacterized protein (TIGR02391 family)
MSLPPDELALRMLRAITAGEQREGFFFGKDRVINPNVGDREQHQRLEEAFAWIVREVWIAHEPTQSSSGNWFFVTRRGWSVLDDPAGLARAQAEARLQVELHPRLAERVRAQFLLGEYEAAAFLAMREVEICVRDRAGAREADLGVALMKSAFGEDGPLSDPQLERGEQQAKMALYWGAIGMFKNPSSHRQVDFDDPTLASEVILLADLLLRLLDRSPRV